MDIRLFRSCGIFLLIVAAGGLPPAAFAAFQPGFFYVSTGQVSGFYSPPSIYEVNPATGQSRLFASFPTASAVNSLLFTPSGEYLRAVVGGRVVELNGDGEVVRATHTSAAGGANSMAYDAAGNFYLSRGREIWRYPGDGPAGEVFAGADDGFIDSPVFGVAPSGEVWAIDSFNYRLFHFSTSGARTIIDEELIGRSRFTLAVDDAGDCYMLEVGLRRYRPGRPVQGDGELVVSLVGAPLDSPSAMFFEMSTNSIIEVGSSIIRAQLDSASVSWIRMDIPFPAIPTRGVARYVPEPASIWGWLACLGILRRHERRAT